MTIETATLINQLNPSYPAHTDPLSENDSHVRLIKATLQATFPNVTAPVTALASDLNTASVTTAGLATLNTTVAAMQTAVPKVPIGTVFAFMAAQAIPGYVGSVTGNTVSVLIEIGGVTSGYTLCIPIGCQLVSATGLSGPAAGALPGYYGAYQDVTYGASWFTQTAYGLANNVGALLWLVRTS